MSHVSDEKIAGLLAGIISDGLNRSLGALEKAGAIDTKKFRTKYTGSGSEYYDLVTEQIEITAKYSASAINRLIEENENRA